MAGIKISCIRYFDEYRKRYMYCLTTDDNPSDRSIILKIQGVMCIFTSSEKAKAFARRLTPEDLLPRCPLWSYELKELQN